MTAAAGLDGKKVAFLIHTTQEAYEKECLFWLNRLDIPQGYSVEYLVAADDADMAEAYEENRQASDARYKIYLEDRTFVTNRFLIRDLLAIFDREPSIGAVGIWGVQADSDRGIGKVILTDSQGTSLVSTEPTVDISGEIYDVVAYLGEGLFATQSDLDWGSSRDVQTQSLRYREAGYKVVVARQRSAWCLLDQEQGQEDSYEWYLRIKFQLRRMEYHFPVEDTGELLDALRQGRISIEVLQFVGMRTLLCYRRVMSFLSNLLRRPGICEANGNLGMAGDRELHVMSSLNRKYVRYVCVMLESLCRWNKEVEIHAWLLHEELEESDKIFIRNALAGRRIKVDFLYVDKRDYENCATTDMWSVEAYFRLSMIELLPTSVDRLLYLDVDTLVLRPVYDLYFADFGGMDIIGCRDLGSGIPFGDMRDDLFRQYVDQDNFAYCNSGVMLWNIAKLRGKISFCDYLQAMEEREYNLIAPDQDIINLVHAGKIKLVDEERYDYFARPMFSVADCEELSLIHI